MDSALQLKRVHLSLNSRLLKNRKRTYFRSLLKNLAKNEQFHKKKLGGGEDQKRKWMKEMPQRSNKVKSLRLEPSLIQSIHRVSLTSKMEMDRQTIIQKKGLREVISSRKSSSIRRLIIRIRASIISLETKVEEQSFIRKEAIPLGEDSLRMGVETMDIRENGSAITGKARAIGITTVVAVVKMGAGKRKSGSPEKNGLKRLPWKKMG
ncbi:hypothetical protein FGO68_gene3011 [Halteria grandinella]|uniref:Uncharacterized protein n=1 Tax=Halteria grandinella TaxID=5974 RepID=A0A8J8TAI1_HALGN|nr:hypothetical protein FGO68_gene3011 [Halteria grandinella]